MMTLRALGSVLAVFIVSWNVWRPSLVEPPGRVVLRLGLTPRSAATGGLTPAQTEVVIGRLSTPGILDPLISANARVDDLDGQVRTLASQLADQPGNPVLLQQYRDAESALADSRQLLAQRTTTIRARVCEGVPPATLQNVLLCAERARHRFPTPFALAPLTPTQRQRAERAIVAERRSLRAGTPMPLEASAFLAEVRARPEVVQAQLSLAANLQAIQSTLYP